MYDVDDTIAAIASAPGGALRGILRISGPETLNCIGRCFRPERFVDFAALRAPCVVPGQFLTNSTLGDVPCDAYLWPGHRSYTRQPTAELHTLGSPPLLEVALRQLCAAGARLAQPGEFTLRAFLAGRLDLTQAEAVLGVIDATTRQELDVALSQLAGGLAGPLHALRHQLLDTLAHLEAGLDFVEEDIEFIERETLLAVLQEAISQVEAIQRQLAGRDAVDDEPQVVLIGSPNVGKSSLLNALVGASAALVSDTAGTTRDYVACRVKLGQRALRVVDTAGVESDDLIDGIAAGAQEMTQLRHAQAALVLLCLDATRELNVWERAILTQPTRQPRIVVLTKADAAAANLSPAEISASPVIVTSSLTGAGLEQLRQAIFNRVGDQTRDAVLGTAARCRDSLQRASESLRRAYQTAHAEWGEELVAAEVRGALDELGTVVGAIYTEDILDRIFSRFCIGK